jgi:hypothetical protein
VAKKIGNWGLDLVWQPSLFVDPNIETAPKHNPWPVIHRTYDGFLKVLREADMYLGIDYEFRTLASGKQIPTIISIANEQEAACLNHADNLTRLVVESDLKLVAHSALGAERKTIEDAIGVRVPLERWEDSMRAMYWTHLDFSKAPDKNVDSDESEQGSGGFMNLWTCSSMYTDLPNWKYHRGIACIGPCPVCAVHDYCAVDSYAGLHVFLGAKREMETKGIPFSSYRDRMMTGEICQAMQDQGVRIDLKYVTMLGDRMTRVKKLFESTEFNPRSPKKIVKYFADTYQISFDDADKESIHKALEHACEKAGVSLRTLDEFIFPTDKAVLKSKETLFDYFGNRDLETEVAFDELAAARVLTPYHAALKSVPKEIAELHKLYVLKGLGKGLDPWFHAKYLRGEFVHPRFVDTGTMTTRLASAKPNFTNIAARGWGKAVKGAIVPRDESFDIVSSDASQLELRNCLYLAGIDPAEAGDDAFTWLQQKAPEFDQAAQERNKGETGRDLAKITSHLSDYCGGVKILYPRDFANPKTKREIQYGCLRPYLKKHGAPFDWEYCGGVVAFTGVILAENLFGNKTQENRKRALQLQEDIFYKAFPQIRKWQRDVSHYVEAHGCLRSPDGRMVELYDTPEENLKKGTAWLGQGVGAAYVTAVMRRYWQEHQLVPLLVVHDDYVRELPRHWTDKQVLDSCQILREEVSILPGFKCPWKTKRGRNWGDCKALVV